MPFANGRAIYSFGFQVVPPNVSSDLASEVVGTPTIQVAGGRFARNCVRMTSSASTVNWEVENYKNGTGTGGGNVNRFTASFYSRYIVKPTLETTILFQVASNTGSVAHVDLNPTTGFWELKVGSGTAVSTGLTPVLNTWYRFDMIYRMDLNPRTFEVRITVDGEATYAYSGTATGPAEAASDGRWLRMGSGAISTQTVEFDDVYLSGAATDGDFPITPQGMHHMTISYRPDSDGTHSVGTGTFRYTDNNGGAFTNILNTETGSWGRVAEVPAKADGSAGDDWVEKSAGTTLADMVEWVLEPVVEPEDPIGVHVHAIVRNDSGTLPNSAFLWLREGTTDATPPVQDGDIGAATATHRGCCYPLAPDGTAWTSAHLNALKIRFSADDVSPIPRIKNVMLEAAFQYSVEAPDIAWITAL